MTNMKKSLVFMLLFIILVLSAYAQEEDSLLSEPAEISEWAGILFTLAPSIYFLYLSKEFTGPLKKAIIFLSIGMFITFISFLIDIAAEGAYSDLPELYHNIAMIVGMIFIILTGYNLNKVIHEARSDTKKK